jgi:UDP-glucose 4-epimerase
MRILITGSRGFVGGSMGRFAAAANHEVLGVGRSGQPAVDWPCDYLQADVATADLSKVIRDFAPELVLHAAGTASVSGSFEAPLDDLRASAITWANTLEGVRRSGIRPLVIFPSSAAVYGNQLQLPIHESAVIAPISPYGFHKAACELLAREYAACFGLQIMVCRIFSLIGEAQRRLLIWEMYRQFTELESTVWLQGTGTESRDYLHVDDFATALLELTGKRQQVFEQDPCLIIINIASGEETKALEIARQMRDFIAPEKTIRCRNIERPGDPRFWRADISLLRSLLPSWQPRSFPSSLARCIATWQMAISSTDGNLLQ